jgi:hypothetical protein
MRYPASEKAKIIGLVEQSHLPVKATLQKLGIPSPPSTAGGPLPVSWTRS